MNKTFGDHRNAKCLGELKIKTIIFADDQAGSTEVLQEIVNKTNYKAKNLKKKIRTEISVDVYNMIEEKIAKKKKNWKDKD